MNGLESHFDNLETTNTDSNLHFNAICITETSQRENDEFKRNINVENFHPVFSTGTKTARGGTAIYVPITQLKEMTLKYIIKNMHLLGLRF